MAAIPGTRTINLLHLNYIHIGLASIFRSAIYLPILDHIVETLTLTI